MNRRGFTLIEVMISLAIVGGLLVTLLYTLNYHMSVATRYETITVATMLGKDKLVELEERPSDTEGKFDEPYTDYTYSSKVRESGYPGVSELSVTVSKDAEKVVVRELIRASR